MTTFVAIAAQIGESPWSVALRQSLWMYPVIETIHVLAIAVFVGFAALLDLRLLGVALRQIRVSHVMTRVMPWTWGGFAVLVATGLLLFFGDPERFAGNVFFQVKALLLVVAGVNAAVFHRTVYRHIAEWDVDVATPHRARLAGAVSLSVWAAVVISGRMIAYNWF